jgi:hypothetical protein
MTRPILDWPWFVSDYIPASFVAYLGKACHETGFS